MEVDCGIVMSNVLVDRKSVSVSVVGASVRVVVLVDAASVVETVTVVSAGVIVVLDVAVCWEKWTVLHDEGAVTVDVMVPPVPRAVTVCGWTNREHASDKTSHAKTWTWAGTPRMLHWVEVVDAFVLLVVDWLLEVVIEDVPWDEVVEDIPCAVVVEVVP